MLFPNGGLVEDLTTDGSAKKILILVQRNCLWGRQQICHPYICN